MQSNKQNGYLYSERGFVELYKFHYEAALKDFKVAESLHYDKMQCQSMIQFAQKAIDIEKRINEKTE